MFSRYNRAPDRNAKTNAKGNLPFVVVPLAVHRHSEEDNESGEVTSCSSRMITRAQSLRRLMPG